MDVGYDSLAQDLHLLIARSDGRMYFPPVKTDEIVSRRECGIYFIMACKTVVTNL